MCATLCTDHANQSGSHDGSLEPVRCYARLDCPSQIALSVAEPLACYPSRILGSGTRRASRYAHWAARESVPGWWVSLNGRPVPWRGSFPESPEEHAMD